MTQLDLDSILSELGQFGKYQVFCFTVLMFPLMMSGFRETEYIFTTMSIPHRCRVPECEAATKVEAFKAPWLQAALPITKHIGADPIPDLCRRYQPIFRITKHQLQANQTNNCSSEMFNYGKIITCNDWVFSEPTKTLANAFSILCPEDHWKLTFLSSAFGGFQLIGLPISGLLSDRVGRKPVLVFGCVALATTGVIRSFSINYAMSIAMNSLDGLLVGFVYTPAFILALEILSSTTRLLGNLLINAFFVFGLVELALVMWATADWRLLLRFLYIPALLLVAIHWLLPESVQWLYTKGRLKDIEQILKKIAKMNRTEQKLPAALSLLYGVQNHDRNLNPSEALGKPSKPNKLIAVLKSRTIMLRLVAFSTCWITIVFSYYGVTQYSVVMFESDNRYVSFILASLIELPCIVASLWLPDWPLLGRKGTIAYSLFLCGISCCILSFISRSQVLLGLTIYLAAKFASTMTLTVVYIYTAEVFPTELRHTLLSLCSMIGRLGSVSARQTPLIETYFNPISLISVVSILGGMVTLNLPETLNTSLPDTIEEAERIGKPQTQRRTQASLEDHNTEEN